VYGPETYKPVSFEAGRDRAVYRLFLSGTATIHNGCPARGKNLEYSDETTS
jgi:hypothetical protein